MSAIPDWQTAGLVVFCLTVVPVSLFVLFNTLIQETDAITGRVQKQLTYYRSVTADGRTWCESRDPDEVMHMSSLSNALVEGPFTYEQAAVYEIRSDWGPWTP